MSITGSGFVRRGVFFHECRTFHSECRTTCPYSRRNSIAFAATRHRSTASYHSSNKRCAASRRAAYGLAWQPLQNSNQRRNSRIRIWKTQAIRAHEGLSSGKPTPLGRGILTRCRLRMHRETTSGIWRWPKPKPWAATGSLQRTTFNTLSTICDRCARVGSQPTPPARLRDMLATPQRRAVGRWMDTRFSLQCS